MFVLLLLAAGLGVAADREGKMADKLISSPLQLVIYSDHVGEEC